VLHARAGVKCAGRDHRIVFEPWPASRADPWYSGQQPKDQAEVQRENQETVARLRQDVEQLKQQVEALSADLHPPSADLQPADRHTRDKWDRIHDLATDIQEMAYPETSQAEEDEEESRLSY
jgi:chromosome segregation ATPase